MHHRFSSDAKGGQPAHASGVFADTLDELAAAQERLLERAFPSQVIEVGLDVDNGSGATGNDASPSRACGSDRVVVRQLGQGPKAVVMLHGIGSGSATWMNAALEISKALPDVRIVAWDAPGYAESTPLGSHSPRAGDYALRLAALLRALGIDEAVLVGHSLGAFAASATARLLGPRVVKRLVLVSPAGGYGAPDQQEQSAKVKAQRLGQLESVGILGMARAVGEPGARMCAPDASASARAWVRWNMARLNDSGYRQAVEMLCGDSLGNHAPVAMPVEVHCGDMDIVTPPASCRATAQDFGASFATIAGAGHASPIEAPAAVAAVVAEAARLGLSLASGAIASPLMLDPR